MIRFLHTHIPFMKTLFVSAPRPLALWLDVLAVGLAAYVLVEVEKWLRRRKAR
jgi:cation-transporting ATPase F